MNIIELSEVFLSKKMKSLVVTGRMQGTKFYCNWSHPH